MDNASKSSYLMNFSNVRNQIILDWIEKTIDILKLDQMTNILQTVVSRAFSKWECLNFEKKSPNFVSKGPIDHRPALV